MISVTNLIDILDKPSLVYWANRIGLEGVNLKDYYSKTKNEGNSSHKDFELFLTQGVLFDGSDKLEKSLEGYEVLGVEKDINNGYICGRIDLVLKKDNIVYVVDFKRNNRIYLKTRLQLACYKHMYGADEIAYINSEKLELEVINIDTEPYWKLVKYLYRINEILIKTNEKL